MTTTRLVRLAKICGDFAVAIHGAAFQPTVLDQAKQSLIVLVASACRFFQPGVVATAMDAKHPTHRREAELICVLLHGDVLCSYPFAK